MNRNRRTGWLVTMLAILALVLAACGGGGAAENSTGQGAGAPAATEPGGEVVGEATEVPMEEEAAPTEEAEETEGEETTTGEGGGTALTLLGWASSEAENTRLSDVVQTFSEQNEQYDATFNPVPEYEAALQTALAGTPPDLFYVNADTFPNLASQGALAPVGDVVDTSEFYEPMIQAFTYEGEVYGVPKDFSVLALVYNTDMFEEAGIEAAPTTWEELRAALEALQEAGQPPMCAAATVDRWGVFALQAGGNFLNEDRTEASFNSEAMVEGLTFYTDLVADGLAVPYGQLDAGWCGEAFGTGRASVTVEGNWIVPFLADSFPDLNWAAAPLPAGPAGQGTWAFTAAYGYSPSTPNPEGSQALLQYLTSEEGMAEWTGLGLAMPTRPALAEGFASQFPELEGFVSSAEFATVRPTAVGFPDVIRELESQVEAIFGGNQTPEAALEQVQGIAEQALQQNQ